MALFKKKVTKAYHETACEKECNGTLEKVLECLKEHSQILQNYDKQLKSIATNLSLVGQAWQTVNQRLTNLENRYNRIFQREDEGVAISLDNDSDDITRRIELMKGKRS